MTHAGLRAEGCNAAMLFWRKKPQPDYIIVGLGNPGPEYERTRHNVGFMAADALAGMFPHPRWRYRWSSLAAELAVDPARALVPPPGVEAEEIERIRERCGADKRHLLVIKPQTYMNRSGRALARVVQANPTVPFVVVSDDVNLPWGKLRLRERGSAGGHKGLDDIIRALGGMEDFARIRIGIGGGELEDVSDYVLEELASDKLADARRFATAAALKALEIACVGYEAAVSSGFAL
ncbi:aminoacyl-tRNA hydrolase [bacterium]|nr:aminoacyl-tRNA hydrolase [bacterium]